VNIILFAYSIIQKKGGEYTMKVTIWKNAKESTERAITRFNKKVQASRKLLKIKGERYHKKEDTKRKSRIKAIKRDHYRSLREKNKFY